jgi:ribosomal protein S18 acetylase RimI-like enzyme
MALVDATVVAMKDGRSATLRCPVREDAEALLVALHTCLEDGVGQVVGPDEMSLTLEQERAFIAGVREHPGKLFLVAEVNGELAGSLQLERAPRKRLAHTAMLGMALLPAFRELGIGAALIDACLDWAIAQGIEKVCLHVLADNERAIALYRKFGFVEEGRAGRAIRYEDGRYVDDIVMGRFVA